MNNLTVIGIDTAKNNIQLHGADVHGNMVFKKRISRNDFLSFMANVPKCLIGMEACAGSHYWATELSQLGFTVKLMCPKRVKKYVDNHKNDARDAAACAEAATRQNVPSVPIKNKRQLEIQSYHRTRSYYVKQQTGLMNTIRGFLLELGIAIPQGKSALVKHLCELLDNPDSTDDTLDGEMKSVIQDLYDDLKRIAEAVMRYTNLLERLAQTEENCKRISTIPGVGPITATAVIAKIGNGSEFKKGRELSAYFGLVPKQNSSGEKHRLGKISKHGDRYIRQLLIHGARSFLFAIKRINKLTKTFGKNDTYSVWARELVNRVGMNKATVAIANKNARFIIALLKGETEFQFAKAHIQPPHTELDYEPVA